MDKLTKKQSKLLKEIEDIIEIIDLDYRNVINEEKESRTPRLEIMKDQIIRSAIIFDYTLIDEYLNMIIVDYFFGKKSNYIKLWKLKNFRILIISFWRSFIYLIN